MAKPILVADANDMMRRVLVSVLEKAGAEVVEAKDGAEAIRRLEEGLVPAAALVETTLPLIDGLEVIRRIKAHPRWKVIPVLAVSSRNTPADVQRAREAGAIEYLLKPKLTKEVVIPAVKRALATLRPKPAAPSRPAAGKSAS